MSSIPQAPVIAAFLSSLLVCAAATAQGAPPAGADALEPTAPASDSQGLQASEAEPASSPAAPASDGGASETGPEWDAYHHAFQWMASGARARAFAALRALVVRSPEHPAALRARALLLAAGPAGGLEAPVQQGVTWPRPAPATGPGVEMPPSFARHRPPEEGVGARRGPTKLARAELIGVQTLMGLGLGIEACVLVNCRSVRAWTFGPVAGAGLALGLSVLATRHGIRPATALAVNMGSQWGAFHGYALAASLGDLYSDRFYGDDPGLSVGDEVTLGMFLGQLGGAGLGYAFDRWLEPTAGDVSLAGSGALWSTLFTLYLGAALRQGDFGRHVRYLHWGLIAAADLGMVLGGLLARAEPMSRGRVLLIDVGAGLGLGLGTGLAVLVAGDGVSASGVFGTGALGLVGGAALAYWITRNWDAPELPVMVGAAPVEGGMTVTLGGTF